MFSDYYNDKFKSRMVDNMNLALKDSLQLRIKVLNFIKKFYLSEYSFEEIFKEIQTNKLVRAIFTVDPKKQNLCEKSQLEYLNKIDGVVVKNIYNKMCLDGKIVDRNNIKKVKSIDFTLNYKNVKYYCFAKHIDSQGGAQTNQFNDLINCINCTRGSSKTFIAIVSGSFFNLNNINQLYDLANIYNLHILDLNRMNSADIICKLDSPSKQARGQFYTTNVDKILQGISIPKWADHIIEPFAGQGDLINWINIKTNKKCQIDMYDIEPKFKGSAFKGGPVPKVIKQDTLLNPPDYDGKYIITNPPYLSRNKCTDKNVKKIFDANPGISDLFRIHISQITDECIGGIVIIPLNFLSSSSKFVKDNEIRDKFLSTYKITVCNLFEEQVFDDTSYTVIAIRFVWSDTPLTEQQLVINSYPSGKKLSFTIKKKYNWIIGGEIYNLPTKNSIEISRLVEGTTYTSDWIISKIYVYAIDGGVAASTIRLEYKEEPFYGKISDRAFATLAICDSSGTDYLTDAFQKKVIVEFNKLLLEYRKKYNSLFLTNFRESKNGKGRKRISFNTVYFLLSHIIKKLCDPA